MNPSQALQYIQGAARLNQFELDSHAIQRMRERKVRLRDVRQAMASATEAVEQLEDGETRWRLRGGLDSEQAPLEVVVAIDDGVLVITVI